MESIETEIDRIAGRSIDYQCCCSIYSGLTLGQFVGTDTSDVAAYVNDVYNGQRRTFCNFPTAADKWRRQTTVLCHKQVNAIDGTILEVSAWSAGRFSNFSCSSSSWRRAEISQWNHWPDLLPVIKLENSLTVYTQAVMHCITTIKFKARILVQLQSDPIEPIIDTESVLNLLLASVWPCM
jgi:hypothetical protein